MLRIFISHSAKDPAVRQLRDELTGALRAAGHQVLLDRDGLELGEDWRSTLNVWMGGCDAAIVLLSEEALVSRFVAYEAAILTYREELDPTFHLLPVVVRPVTSAAIKDGALGSTLITRQQAVVAEQGQNALAIEALVARLNGLPSDENPLDRIALLLAEVLERARISDARVTDQLRALGVDMPPWVPADNVRAQLVVAMLAAGLQRNVAFIRSIRKQLDRDLPDLIDLLACSWVDYRAIREIPAAASSQRIIAANASDPLTARMYVIRSAIDNLYLPPSDSWIIGEIDAISPPPDHAPGPAAPGLSHAAVELERQMLRALEAPFGAVGPDEVREELERRADREPVFVALPAGRVNASVLLELRDAYPEIAFFVLAGSDPPARILADHAVFLRPELESGAEPRFCGIYAREKSYLVQQGGS